MCFKQIYSYSTYVTVDKIIIDSGVTLNVLKIFQTTGLLLSALGNLSAMTDLGDSKDDAESLLEQLKEITTKCMVSANITLGMRDGRDRSG